MKYEIITTDKKEYHGRPIYRIRALENIYTSDSSWIFVHKGALGGYIYGEEALSQEGSCWVYDNSIVADRAEINGNAIIRNNSEIFDCAKVYDNAIIDNSNVYGCAKVFGNANAYESKICHCAKVYDHTIMFNSHISGDDTEIYGKSYIEKSCIADNAKIYGQARVIDSIVKGNSIIKDCCEILNDSTVTDNAIVCGSAVIRGSYLFNDAIISQNMYLKDIAVGIDLSKDLEASILAQTGLVPCNGKVIAYKEVNNDFSSNYDKSFKYKVGEIVEVKDCDENPELVCGPGLHFSNAKYWVGHIKDSIFLTAEIELKDILSVQAGKIRCRRAKIIGSYKPKTSAFYQESTY